MDHHEPSFYAIIPADVRYCKALPPSAKLLYGELTALAKKKGYCWASNAYFADLYEVEERQIKRWLEALKVEGFIHVEITKNGLKSERKIWVSQRMFTKGQKRPFVENNLTPSEDASTDGFQRRVKKDPLEGSKKTPKDIHNLKEQQQHSDAGDVDEKIDKFKQALTIIGIADIHELEEFDKRFFSKALKNYRMCDILFEINHFFSHKKKSQRSAINNPPGFILNNLKENYAHKSTIK